MLDIKQINDVLSSFKIKGRCVSVKQNRHFVFCDLKLEPGSLNKIQRSLDEISLYLKSFSTPFLKLKPSLGFVELQLTTAMPDKLYLSDLLGNVSLSKNSILLGESINGEAFLLNLDVDPHLLVAGTTGSGKSNLLHNIIWNACVLQQNQFELHLIDPKKIEFDQYRDNKNVHSVSNSYNETIKILEHLISVMEQRYSLLTFNKNIKFNKKLIIIDELADLMFQDKDHKFETLLVKIAAKARACGIHIIAATQRPSVDVVTGLMKANFPARLACKVASKIDSQVILDEVGAQNLLGKGDALFKGTSSNLIRLQIALVN